MPAVNDEQLEEVAYLNYGELITNTDAISSDQLADVYANLQPNDSTAVKVRTTINEVCAKKGCWIEVPAGDATARVTFKDYGFFLPRNSQGQEVILEGMAYKSKTSIDDLKHYAQDGGKSQQEIDAIVQDEITLSFEATGALVEPFENPDVVGATSSAKSE
ncbi:hypothetical protein NMS_2544 [Nonlabens marinus S1-08]|uniref:DUF4920 domain-containing protein n=2 Tax=Nonlabens TaxID=363408 RepID=W8VWR1_9FLAO|nr:hypothetical protein NMS_2544 [Nonlabens marinus S1-08]